MHTIVEDHAFSWKKFLKSQRQGWILGWCKGNWSQRLPHLVNLSLHIFLRTKQIHFSFIIFIIVFPWSDTPSEFILCSEEGHHRYYSPFSPPPSPQPPSSSTSWISQHRVCIMWIYSSRENLAWILYCCYLSHIIKYFWTESSTMYYWMIKPKVGKEPKTWGHP